MNDLTITQCVVHAVQVPMAPHKTASGTVSVFPLVLFDLHTSAGIVGRSYIFTYTPLALKATGLLARDISSVVANELLAPRALHDKLQSRFRLLGTKGLLQMVLAGIDMAAWDAFAQWKALPLASALGYTPTPARAYLSAGLATADEARREVEAAMTAGFKAVKFKIGHPTLAEDVAMVHAARTTGGASLVLMVDYNQSLSVTEAVRRVSALREFDLHWVEEPVGAFDFAAHAAVRAQTRVPIQTGENWWSVSDMRKAIDAGASDHVMPDVMKIGGVSAWLDAAALAREHGKPVSSHLFPEFSAHVLAATPTRHFLEYTDWANPILAEPFALKDGFLIPNSTPGAGIVWNEAAIAQRQVTL